MSLRINPRFLLLVFGWIQLYLIISCRYGYGSLDNTILVWNRTRAAGIPFVSFSRHGFKDMVNSDYTLILSLLCSAIYLTHSTPPF